MKDEYKISKIGKNFFKEIDNIPALRKARNLDDRPISLARVTNAIVQYPEWKSIKQRLISDPPKEKLQSYDLDFLTRPKKMSKRGALTDYILLMVGALIIVTILAGLVYSSNFIKQTMDGMDDVILYNSTSIKNISDETWGKVDVAVTSGFKVLAIAMLFSIVLFIFITNYFQQTQPWLFVVYIFFIILLVAGSVYISNAYEEILKEEGDYFTVLNSFTFMNYFILNLHYFMGFIGIVGGIFLFINLPKDNFGGGGISI